MFANLAIVAGGLTLYGCYGLKESHQNPNEVSPLDLMINICCYHQRRDRCTKLECIKHDQTQLNDNVQDVE